MNLNKSYEGLKVLVTGGTGFKGAWLSIWLRELGANVSSYSLPPPTTPSLFTLAHLKEKMEAVEGDLRDLTSLRQAIAKQRPQIIFHLAAQAIVLEGYQQPVDTFSTNAMGTVHLLEAVRHCPDVRAVVVVTTDKCYENCDWVWGYRENDRLGGHDPYSASKAMAELAVASYRRSFFNDSAAAAIATARAGNVIGGGDFSPHRLLPDAMKALSAGEAIRVRHPTSIRPWMHVLDPLNGYLLLGARLLNQGKAYAQAWNFGPCETTGISVQEMVTYAIDQWREGGEWVDCSDPQAPAEKGLLRLNWDKAAHQLSWRPRYNWQEGVCQTVEWVKAYRQKRDIYDLCVEQIEQFSGATQPYAL